MKKFTTVATAAVLAIMTVSCSKSSSSEFTTQQSSSQSVRLQPEVTTVSNWTYPNSFFVETDRLGNRFIKGVCPFSASSQLNYDESTHIELAYVRIPTGQRILYRYKRLPFDFNIVNNGISGDVLIDYSLDPDGLKLYFKNADYTFLSRAVDQSASDNWNFRYIVVPKTKYQSTNIDWNDLSAVAAALNFTL